MTRDCGRLYFPEKFSSPHGHCPAAGLSQPNVSSMFPPILRTLPLSGRQGAWGGVAESWWGPVHSRGLFEGVIHRLQLSIEQLREEDKNPSMSSAPTNLARNPDSRLLLGNSVTRL